jgi:hypothetical protein
MGFSPSDGAGRQSDPRIIVVMSGAAACLAVTRMGDGDCRALARWYGGRSNVEEFRCDGFVL